MTVACQGTHVSTESLAILGGPKAVPDSQRHEELFHWPIVTKRMSRQCWPCCAPARLPGRTSPRQFEQEFAQYLAVKHALGYCNGTMSLLSAMWAMGLRRGDELICPSITYWASAIPAFSLGATVVYADIDRRRCVWTAADIERHISPRTKIIMVVHYRGYPADMDAIMAVARRHNLKVLEMSLTPTDRCTRAACAERWAMRRRCP